MTAYWLIVCHLIGDYLLQSDWMALEKTKRSLAALAHVITYTLPFLLLTRSPAALLFIAGTHFVIDRWRLARYVCWFKNFLSPEFTREEIEGSQLGRDVQWWHRWADCAGTGYHKDRPPWLAVWLMIVADNTMHLICNGIALEYLG